MASCIHAEGVAVPVAGLGATDVTQAVFGQFKAAEVTQAMGFLQRQGVLNRAGVKRALELTSAFHSSMQVRRQCCAAAAQCCTCIPFRNTQGISHQRVVAHYLHGSLPVRCSGCSSGPGTAETAVCSAARQQCCFTKALNRSIRRV